jgi:dUTP pyrophosphatase
VKKILVVFELLSPDVRIPTRATPESAGLDVRAYLQGKTIQEFQPGGVYLERECGERYVITPGTRVLIPLGFRTQLPNGIEAQLRARSSLALRYGLIIPNAPATIDADYREEWKVPLANIGTVPVEIHHDQRIAQVIIARVENAEWQSGELRSSGRIGGFGSTGEI